MRLPKFRAFPKEVSHILCGMCEVNNIDLKDGFIEVFNPAKMGIPEVFPIERFELLQFIDYRDRKYKEVYNGDILHSESGNLAIVKWRGGNHNGFVFVSLDNKRVFTKDCCWTVIGNIYENPELLKQ